jgi:hypothetical protein
MSERRNDMGTNYYLLTNYCEHCKRGDKEHLGKSSGGWTFSFVGSFEIRTKKDWLYHILDEIDKGSKIQNEYGEELSFEDIRGSWLDPEGNSFTGYDFS